MFRDNLLRHFRRHLVNPLLKLVHFIVVQPQKLIPHNQPRQLSRRFNHRGKLPLQIALGGTQLLGSNPVRVQLLQDLQRHIDRLPRKAVHRKRPRLLLQRKKRCRSVRQPRFHTQRLVQHGRKPRSIHRVDHLYRHPVRICRRNSHIPDHKIGLRGIRLVHQQQFLAWHRPPRIWLHRRSGLRWPPAEYILELLLHLLSLEISSHCEDRVPRSVIGLVKLHGRVSLYLLQRNFIPARRTPVAFPVIQIPFVIFEDDVPRAVLRRLHSVHGLRNQLIHFRLRKRRMQQGIRHQLQPFRRVLREKLCRETRIIRARVRLKSSTDEINVPRELLRHPRLRALPQQSRRSGSQPFHSRRIVQASRLHDPRNAHHRHAMLFQQQHRQSILQYHLLMRRHLQSLRVRRRRPSRQRDSHNQRESRYRVAPASCRPAGQQPSEKSSKSHSHGLPFSSFSGTSVATVRFLAPKYSFATRCTSSFVTML